MTVVGVRIAISDIEAVVVAAKAGAVAECD